MKFSRTKHQRCRTTVFNSSLPRQSEPSASRLWLSLACPLREPNRWFSIMACIAWTHPSPNPFSHAFSKVPLAWVPYSERPLEQRPNMAYFLIFQHQLRDNPQTSTLLYLASPDSNRLPLCLISCQSHRESFQISTFCCSTFCNHFQVKRGVSEVGAVLKGLDWNQRCCRSERRGRASLFGLFSKRL